MGLGAATGAGRATTPALGVPRGTGLVGAGVIPCRPPFGPVVVGLAGPPLTGASGRGAFPGRGAFAGRVPLAGRGAFASRGAFAGRGVFAVGALVTGAAGLAVDD
jgi:hypothetical protein